MILMMARTDTPFRPRQQAQVPCPYIGELSWAYNQFQTLLARDLHWQDSKKEKCCNAKAWAHVSVHWSAVLSATQNGHSATQTGQVAVQNFSLLWESNPCRTSTNDTRQFAFNYKIVSIHRKQRYMNPYISQMWTDCIFVFGLLKQDIPEFCQTRHTRILGRKTLINTYFRCWISDWTLYWSWICVEHCWTSNRSSTSEN